MLVQLVKILAHSPQPSKVTYGPEVVDQQVEHTEDDHQHDRTELCLEPNHNHHAGHKSKQAHNHPPDPPLPCENEPDEQEYQQHPARELEVHFTILLIHLWQPSWCEPLADPAVRQHHQKPAHDAEIAEEEVEVEDEAVPEGLGDDYAEETEDGVFAMFPDDHESGTGHHGENVDE